MALFSPLMGAVLVMVVSNMTFSAAQRVFLSSNNLTPCYNSTVDLICHYPDVMERVNGQRRYTPNTPSWRVNGEDLFPDDDVFVQRPINQTSSRLRVRIDPAIFTGNPVSFTCYLPLTSGGEDSVSTVVDPQDTAAPPTFSDLVVNGTNVTVSWNHTNKGPCFNHLTFSYNITWYPVGRVPQRGEGQSVLTGPGATEYILTNLMSDTDYQVELFGFTPSEPVMYSEVATVDFTTEVPPIDESPTGEGGGDSTATIAGSVVFVITVIVAIAIIMAVCFWLRGSSQSEGGYCPQAGIMEIPREGRDTEEEQKKSRERAAGASVQTHYADLDPKWLNDVSVYHTDNEMFTVQYAVVDRAAISSQTPHPEVAKTTSVEAVVRGVQLISDSFMDGTHRESPIPAATPTAKGFGAEWLKLEDSELVLGTVKTSQPKRRENRDLKQQLLISSPIRRQSWTTSQQRHKGSFVVGDKPIKRTASAPLLASSDVGVNDNNREGTSKVTVEEKPPRVASVSDSLWAEAAIP